MQLVNELEVDAPVEQVWTILSDVGTVVRCVPGAEIVGSSGNDYDGRVTVKVGPVSMRLAGVVTILERDDQTHRMVVQGRAKDLKGQGGVAAKITLLAGPLADTRTRVEVLTDLDLSGPAGQLGSGMVRQVNKRLLAQFADRLRAMLETGQVGVPPEDLADSAPQRRGLAGAAQDSLRGRTGETLREVLPVLVGGLLLGRAISRAVRRRAS